jgi:hypothetical protein
VFPYGLKPIPMGCGDQRLGMVAVAISFQRGRRGRTAGRALMVAVGTYVPAELGSCADAKLAVDAR